MNKQKSPRHSWQSVGSHLGDKLMDTGNLVFGALVVGQLLSGQPYNWWLTLGGLIMWIGFFIVGTFLVYFSRGDE